MLEGNKKEGAGYAKILGCCALASRDQHEWVWIDTCCIDKKSSAEMSEAINSMFKWYKNSQICYAYLSDIKRDWAGGWTHWPTFERSKWFTRGWTLQELIAPSQLLFYDSDWNMIGARFAMLERITAATGIPSQAYRILSPYSVAQKMSWASKRTTSRTEDIAYCLFGLFNVNMPLLYGEGISAFTRLQHEIIRTSSDETLFIWGGTGSFLENPGDFFPGSLLAPTPASFAPCGDINNNKFFQRKPYLVTNQGLKISTSIYTVSREDSVGSVYQQHLLPVNCHLGASSKYPGYGKQDAQLALEVLRLNDAYYCRSSWCKMPMDVEEIQTTKTIYLGP